MLNLFTEPVTLSHFLIVGVVLFVSGLVTMATKRNAIGVLMGIELVLNGASLNFIAFANPQLRVDSAMALGLDGHFFTLFVIVLAAAEAAVALAIVLRFYHDHTTVDIEEADELKG